MDYLNLFRPVCDKLQLDFFAIDAYCSVSGGSINDAYTLRFKDGLEVFIKINSDKFSEMFAKEARGLKALSEAGSPIRVPQVLSVFETQGLQYLVLEQIQCAAKSPFFWEDFGRGLAYLHKIPYKTFGFEEDNFIGSMVQVNTLHENWFAFFAEHRIGYQVKAAEKKGLLSQNDLVEMDRFLRNVAVYFEGVGEQAALIHGDLWSGNFLSDEKGDAVLIDPAVYRSIPEMELSMTALFGGFPDKFYEAYLEINPLQEGFKDRMAICGVYHLLNHLNIFGSGYFEQLKSRVKPYL